jgi:hypothetical protein
VRGTGPSPAKHQPRRRSTVGEQIVERVARLVRATLLADDGSGEPYRHIGEERKDRRLDGPGYPGDGFSLPAAKLPDWYGIGATTGERGLRELRSEKLPHAERLRRPDAESPVGFSWANYHELRPPFGPRGVLSKGVHPQWMGAEPKLKKKSVEDGGLTESEKAEILAEAGSR